MKLTDEQINKALNNIKIEGIYPCSVIEADFESDEVTLKMQGDYKVSVGPMLLARVDSVADDKALEQHRAEFEGHFKKRFPRHRFDRFIDGSYENDTIYFMWLAWQAARGVNE